LGIVNNKKTDDYNLPNLKNLKSGKMMLW